MAKKQLLVLGTVLTLATVARTEWKCKMRYDVRSYMTWFDFGSNMVYGLYERPPPSVTECPKCQDLGNLFGELHYTVVDLEDNR